MPSTWMKLLPANTYESPWHAASPFCQPAGPAEVPVQAAALMLGLYPAPCPPLLPAFPSMSLTVPAITSPRVVPLLSSLPSPPPPRISGAGLTLKPLSQSLLLAETQRRWLDPHLRKIARVAAWEADGTGPWKCGCRCHDCARLSGAPPPRSPQRLPTTQSSAKARPVSLLNISCNRPLPPARTGASHHQPE